MSHLLMSLCSWNVSVQYVLNATQVFVPGFSVARLNMCLHIVRFAPLLSIPLKLDGNLTILPRCLKRAVNIPRFVGCTPAFPVWYQKVLWTLHCLCQWDYLLFSHVVVERGWGYQLCQYFWVQWFRPQFQWWEMTGWLAWLDFLWWTRRLCWFENIIAPHCVPLHVVILWRGKCSPWWWRRRYLDWG